MVHNREIYTPVYRESVACKNYEPQRKKLIVLACTNCAISHHPRFQKMKCITDHYQAAKDAISFLWYSPFNTYVEYFKCFKKRGY